MEFRGLPTGSVSSCIYQPDFYECEEENLYGVFITKKSELVELGENGLVLAWCRLPYSLSPQPDDSSIIIKVFYTYQPYSKYYLVHINKELFVIKKLLEGQLKVQKTVKSVSKFFIKHSENELDGKVFALYDGDSLPSAVDLYSPEEITCSTKRIGDTLLKVKSQIQGLDTRLKSAQQVLDDKRIFALQLSGNLMVDAAFDSHLTGIPMINIIGDSPVKLDNKRTWLITFGKLWTRICFNSWVIGVFVSNKHESVIEDLELCAAYNGCSVNRTVIWTKNGTTDLSPLLTDFTPVKSLPAHDEGYVVGVINEKFLITSQFKLPFILSYNVEGVEEQCYLGSIDVSWHHELSNNCRPFEKENEVSDLLSLITINSSIDMSYQIINKEMATSNMFTDMGFTELSAQYHVYKFRNHSPLSGVLISGSKQQDIKIFFRYRRQLMWVLNLLSGKVSWNVGRSNVGLNLAPALHQEVTTLAKCIQDSETGRDSSLEKWVPVLLQREKQTDISFHNNKQS